MAVKVRARKRRINDSSGKYMKLRCLFKKEGLAFFELIKEKVYKIMSFFPEVGSNSTCRSNYESRRLIFC